MNRESTITIKDIAVQFCRWWRNSPGTNFGNAFDQWVAARTNGDEQAEKDRQWIEEHGWDEHG